MRDVLGVDTDRADRMIGLIVGVIVPHLDESCATLRAAGSTAELVDETNRALRHVAAGLETMGWLARFVDARTRAASAVDSAPAMPPGATLEGVAGYLDQYLQTGPHTCSPPDEGPNATHARDLFDHAVRTGALIERDRWFQPVSCADACESPCANPASRALLGVENMVEAEAMAEGQLDMIAGRSGVATLQIMRGAFKRFQLNPPEAASGSTACQPANCQLTSTDFRLPTSTSLTRRSGTQGGTRAIRRTHGSGTTDQTDSFSRSVTLTSLTMARPRSTPIHINTGTARTTRHSRQSVE